MNKQGRPVLVGTTSVEQSEELADQLGEQGVPFAALPLLKKVLRLLRDMPIYTLHQFWSVGRLLVHKPISHSRFHSVALAVHD